MSKTLGSLTVGAKIEVPVLSAYQSRFGSKIVFKIADKNHSGYPSNSVTLITEKIIQNMASDAKEPNNSNSDRKSYGNNRHIHSNLLQWLNSNAAAGAWYSAKHSADQAPTTKNTHVTYNPYTSDTLCQGCLRNFFALFKLFCTIIQNKPLNLIGHRFLARFAEMQLDTIGCLSNPLYHNGLLCTLCGQRGSGRGGGAGVGFVAHRLSFQR